MNWLEVFANGIENSAANPSADLALRWITSWKEATEFGEEPKRQKRISRCRRDEIDFEKRLAWFGDLRAFQLWLETKTDDPEARLVLALTAEFEHKQVQKYLTEVDRKLSERSAG